MATIAQLKAQRDAIAKQIVPYAGADSRAQEQRYAAKMSDLRFALAKANGVLWKAQWQSSPVTKKTRAQLESAVGKLISLAAQGSTEGGSLTEQKAKAARTIFAAYGGDASLKNVVDEMKRRKIWEPYLAAHQSESLWVSTFRPALKVAAVAAAAYYGAGLLQTSASVGVPATATVPTVATGQGIAVAGVGTGYSTGVAAVDTVLGTIGTGATAGAVTAGVSGGSVSQGIKAGAVQGALSGTVGAAKALLPSVSIDLPKIDLPGSSGGSIIDDILKNALKGAEVPKLGVPYAVPVAEGEESGIVQKSRQIGAGLDWKLIAGIVSGVAGVISIFMVR